MKIYFLSSQPCALTLNGVYFGLTDKFERFAEITLKDRVFASFAPEGALPLNFFITEELRFTPPDGCEVYLLKDGIAVYAKDFPPADHTLKILEQKRFSSPNCLVTLFKQGVLQLSAEYDDSFFVATLPPSFIDCKPVFYGELLFLESKNRFAVYNKSGKCLLREEILAFSVGENTLHATLPLSDSLNRIAECTWELTDTECIRTQFVIRQESASDAPPDGLLAYAFFEGLLIGADVSGLLCDELASSTENLKEFLGEYESVILTDTPNVCGLVRQKRERLYEAAYFTVEIENGKITDVKSC